MNVERRNEWVYTDMIYSDTPAVDREDEYAQVYVRRQSLFIDVYFSVGMECDFRVKVPL